ncbi:MAG TPA: hypothetical protein VK421_14880, partial [Pyrinomonadaceae bacterium]|nr:hypothetical protein [Pyrinomonadaceae bacterium]
MKSPRLNICPCCGAQIDGDLQVDGCRACGALAVGPPLARPEHELPALGLPLAVAASGALLALVFVVSTLFALLAQKTFSLSFGSVLAAAETAAWRLKWLLLPLSVGAAYAGRRALAHIRLNRTRYAAPRLAHAGFSLSALVAFAAYALVGVTVPERLHQRRVAAESARNAEAYEPIKVLLEYQQQYGSLPASADDLRKLPDPDGSVARAAEMIRAGAYDPDATIASLPPATTGARGPARVGVRQVSLRPGLDDVRGQGLAFTNYTLRLPGPDRKL